VEESNQMREEKTQEFPSVLHAIASHACNITEKTTITEAETGRECTYGDLWAYVKAFANQLHSAGVERDYGDGYGTRVVVRCEQTIDYIVTALAVQLAGGVFVPVEKNIADARIIEIMEETDSTILVANKPLADFSCTYIPLPDATAERYSADEEDIILPDPEALAIILFTTGTTGQSKGVMITHKAIKARALFVYSMFEHDDEQVYLIPNPLSHAYAYNRLNLALLSSCTIVLLNGFAIVKPFFSAIKNYSVTIINLVSSVTEMYLRTCRDNLYDIKDQITCISLAASAFTESQISALQEIFTTSKIMQLYASTEVHGCYIDHSIRKYSPFCVGAPYDGCKVVFFNEQKEHIIEANRNNPGLFAMSSETGMSGYWKNPELTANVTRGEFIIISDLGYKEDDGLFYFVSRADDIIISGGYKIAPLEIEKVADSYEGILESACVPISDPIMGQVPKLYVVMAEGYSFNAGEIYKYLQCKLEATRLPRQIEEIEELPRIGDKINRNELREKV